MKKRKPTKTLAVVDIGSNSFHLILVQPSSGGKSFRIVRHEKEYVRLGSKVSEANSLSNEAISSGILTLIRFKAIADSAAASIRAVATSALREASNKKEFLEQAADLGLHIEIISGIEEARFTYLGVLQALSVFKKQILLIDIGGGSTELLVGSRGAVHYADSIKLGTIELTERFFPEGIVNPGEIKECRRFIRGMLRPFIRRVRNQPYEMVVGSSGTILNIAKMIKDAGSKRQTTTLNNFNFTKKDLYRVIAVLIAAETKEERLKISGVNPSRADIIVPGALILEQLFEALKMSDLTVSKYALREGIVYDTLNREHFPQID